MRRLFGIILFIALIFSFIGCDLFTNSSQNNQENGQNPQSQIKVEDLYLPDECDYIRPKRSELESTNPTYDKSKKKSLDFIFNTETLGETTIVIRRSEWNKLCNDYRYFYKNENCVHAESYIYEKDGRLWELKDVGFRLRGNTSRYCPQGLDNGREQNQRNKDWNGDYYDTEGLPNNRYRQTHFKIDFEEFLDDEDELKMSNCMKGVNLKRMDASCTREIFCYDLFHRYGIWTAPRASHTTLTLKIIEDIENPKATEPTTSVNYGVYEMFEEVNKQSLKARAEGENDASNAWKNNKGNLWKCANDFTMGRIGEMGVEDIRVIRQGEKQPDGMKTNGREYGTRVGYVWKQYSMDLKTNKDDFDSAAAEFRGFITELNQLPKAENENDSSAISEIKAFYEKWFDVDFFLKTYAVNILCGMDDDYWGNANNFYLYFDTDSKGSGKVYLIPFDYDNTLGCSIKEGGFEHDPFDWGRGANRPLMDKLFMVPEYKEKFAELLKEVSAEDSEWTFEKCSQRFLDYKALVSDSLYSPDLTGRQGTLSWGDYTWQPDGYSLTKKSNNIFDATRLYIRLNLGEEIEGLKAASVKETIKNPDGSGTAKSDCELSVTVKDNGLLITKKHNSVWDHVSIQIYDKTDSKDNVRIVTDEKTNEFLYPFVKKGHLYTVGLTMQSSSYNWEYLDAIKEGISVLVQADGGLGTYRITNSGYSYYSPSYSIIFSDYVVTKPNIPYVNERIEGTICDDGSWEGNREYPNNLTIKDSLTGTVLDLSSKKDFLRGKQKIFVDINQKFTYSNINYEYTIIANYDRYFRDTNNDSSIKYPASEEPKEQLQNESGSKSDPDGEKVTKTASKQNPNGTSSDCTVTVTPKYNGLYITKSHDSVWDHVAIHVRDITIGKENVRIATDAGSNAFLYPFVEKGHDYEVWLTVQSEPNNWYYSDFKDMKVTVTAKGGKGNYWVSHSSYYYDSPTYSIVFKDLTFARPKLDGVKPRIDAGLYYAEWEGENRWPSNLPLYKSVLDLSKESSFLSGQPSIFVSITLKFSYNGNNYEYTILENYGNLFKDTHTR